MLSYLVDSIVTWNENFINSFNLGLHIYVFLFYYLLYNFEIIILKSIADILLWVIWYSTSKIYNNNKFKLVKKPKRLIFLFKVYYFITKYTAWIQPYDLIRRKSFESYEDELFYSVISIGIVGRAKEFIDKLLAPTVKNITSLILAFIFTFRINVNYLITEMINNLIKGNLQLLIDYLKLIPILISVIILVVVWYYTSVKGQFARAATQANKNLLQKTLDMHRKILSILPDLIQESSRNIQYALINRDSIITYRSNMISPFIKTVKDGKVEWRSKKSYGDNEWDEDTFPCFNNIKEINQIIEILKEADKENVYNSLFWLSWYKYEMRGINELRNKSTFEDLEKSLNREFFTKKWFDKIMIRKPRFKFYFQDIQENLPNEENKVYVEEYILKEIEEFTLHFDRVIIHAIEKLIKLSIYYNSTSQFLHPNSNKFGRRLRFVIGKE